MSRKYHCSKVVQDASELQDSAWLRLVRRPLARLAARNGLKFVKRFGKIAFVDPHNEVVLYLYYNGMIEWLIGLDQDIENAIVEIYAKNNLELLRKPEAGE